LRRGGAKDNGTTRALLMPLVAVRFSTSTEYVRFQNFSQRLKRPSPRTQVCVVRSCVPRVHVSGRPILHADVDMVIEAKTSSGSDSIGDAEGNMMWCSSCGGEGVVYSLSKKQKRARRLEREAAAGAPVECRRDLSSSERLARAPPAKVAPCKPCMGTGLVPTPCGKPQKPHLESPRVAIVGAGIGGAALALALQQRGVHVSLFERDTSFSMRKQGYGLTLQKYSGAAALKQLGVLLDGVGSNANISLTADGRELGRYGFGTRLYNDQKVAVNSASDAGRKNVHLPRQALRRVLLEKLSPGTVHWGKKFKNYKETTCSTSSVVELQFEDGDRLSFDLLVGADGIFSAVRPVKLAKNSRDAAVGEAYPLHYLGVFVMLGICHGVSHPLCDHKVFQVVDGTTRIYVMPFSRSCNGDGCLALRQGDEVSTQNNKAAVPLLMWQLSFPISEEKGIELAKAGPAKLLSEAVERCGSWVDPVPELISSTSIQNLTGYPAYDRACLNASDLRNMSDEHSAASRVTLIGDAAHPMSPFKGQGANQALLDAVQLARALFRTPTFSPSRSKHRQGLVWQSESCSAGLFDGDVATALSDFEKTMCTRSKEKVRLSRDAAAYLHSNAALAEGNCVRAHAAARAAKSLTDDTI